MNKSWCLSKICSIIKEQNEHSHAHQHGPPEAPVEDVDDREEGDDVEDRAIVGQQGHQVM